MPRSYLCCSCLRLRTALLERLGYNPQPNTVVLTVVHSLYDTIGVATIAVDTMVRHLFDHYPPLRESLLT